MTSSSSPQTERGLDAMLIVYSLLNSHPASPLCEQFIRAHTGWFTTTFTLFEAKAILTKVYAVDAAIASQKLAQFAAGPIVIVAVDLSTAIAAMSMADALNIDLTDAVLLQASQVQEALWLATDDSKLTQACRQVGITPETPWRRDRRLARAGVVSFFGTLDGLRCGSLEYFNFRRQSATGDLVGAGMGATLALLTGAVSASAR